jgi:hypothetical protein
MTKTDLSMSDSAAAADDDIRNALGALLHDGEIVAIRRGTEEVEIVFRPGIGDASDDGSLLHARFSQLRECSVHRPQCPVEPVPIDAAAKAAWWARVSRTSAAWETFEAAVASPNRWYEIMDASYRPRDAHIELELYGPLAGSHPDGRRDWDADEWLWVTVRAGAVAWFRHDGSPLDIDFAIALAIVWWDHWSAQKPPTMTAAEAAAAGPLPPGTRIVGPPFDRSSE